MKKIFFITLFLILSFLSSFAASANGNKIAEQKNTYYYGNISPNFYDLNTFKYSSSDKTYSIDVFYWIDYWHLDCDIIKSPFDNKEIAYLIFNTKYTPKNGKLILKYKGFLTSDSNKEESNEMNFKNIKLHYNNDTKIIPNLCEHINNLQQWLGIDGKPKYTYYIKDVTKDIFNAYEKGNWGKLKYLKNSLEEF